MREPHAGSSSVSGKDVRDPGTSSGRRSCPVLAGEGAGNAPSPSSACKGSCCHSRGGRANAEGQELLAQPGVAQRCRVKSPVSCPSSWGSCRALVPQVPPARWSECPQLWPHGLGPQPGTACRHLTHTHPPSPGAPLVPCCPGRSWAALAHKK